ncbi:MAG TPA: tetratricopeptide repeat protein [Candidatus Ozemobacteraceae bacterium]|nr:tetratricopeptide repeat protein [Candidatus Ozemobacteraceae bacterium]
MVIEKNPSAYFSTGLLEELCEENRRKLAADPENDSLHFNLANALSRLGKFDEAVTEYQAAIQRQPKPVYLNNLGKTLNDMGNYEEATRIFDQVLQLTKWPDTWYHKALAFKQLGRLEEADQALLEALKLNPQYREAINARGEVLEALNKPVEALFEYKKVIALFFSDDQTRESEDFDYDLSILYSTTEMVDESIRQLERFVKKNPGFADAHYKLGLAYQAAGREHEAMLAFRRALEINPRYETARQSFWKR